MLITLEIWNSYFGVNLVKLSFGAREEQIALSLFYYLFPNLPKYADLTDLEQQTTFEYALMEQINFMQENF